jgi:6-phosphofructokinase 1
MSNKLDLKIDSLGEAKFPSPLKLSTQKGDGLANFIEDSKRILYHIETDIDQPQDLTQHGLLEMAGPRQNIFFDPAKTHAGIVTCGGLCPGLNDVIRSLVMSLWHSYGVRKISGFQFGYRGLIPDFGLKPIMLNPDIVKDIHLDGGTMLGSSRGYGERTEDMAATLERLGVNILFTIGGDGTQRAALDLSKHLAERGKPMSVIGIPKTVDNDLSFVQRSFGFVTAATVADHIVAGAHVEAKGAPNGIGLVKVMGRHSGFIAAATAVANNDVNFVLIPEVPFDLEGKNGFLHHLELQIKDAGHALIIVAEGAGQEFLELEGGTDASGNTKLGDIGDFLADRINGYFKEKNTEVNLKYFDPSYSIRSTPANTIDSFYCTRLGAHAVHAAMAGKTGLIVSLLNSQYVHVPIQIATTRRNTVDPEGSLWLGVLESTGQPMRMKNQVE